VSSPILDDFDRRAKTFQGLCDYLQSVLPALLKSHKIRFHKLEGRVKKRKSLEEKLTRPDKNYTTLDNVTDICGLRIITHYKSEVDQIATIIEREFAIDRDNSVDKRIYTDPDRFGYVSLHYVISLPEARLTLTECKAWKGYKAEIQIRTILEHAWAEIEHDLGFKSSVAVPREVKRRFARLAALLELADDEFADDEFAGIKADLAQYTAKVSERAQNCPTKCRDRRRIGKRVGRPRDGL